VKYFGKILTHEVFVVIPANCGQRHSLWSKTFENDPLPTREKVLPTREKVLHDTIFLYILFIRQWQQFL